MKAKLIGLFATALFVQPASAQEWQFENWQVRVENADQPFQLSVNNNINLGPVREAIFDEGLYAVFGKAKMNNGAELARGWDAYQFRKACAGVIESVFERKLGNATLRSANLGKVEQSDLLLGNLTKELLKEGSVFGGRTNVILPWKVVVPNGICFMPGIFSSGELFFDIEVRLRKSGTRPVQAPSTAQVTPSPAQLTRPSGQARQPALTVRTPYRQIEAPPPNVREKFVAAPLPRQPKFPLPCAGKKPGCVVSDSYKPPREQVQAIAAWEATVAAVNRRNAAERKRVDAINAQRQAAYDAWATREAKRRREHENPSRQ